MGGWRGDKQDGTWFMGNQLSRASAWEPPATLIPSSVCRVVLLAGCALSSEVTCMWTWEHVNRTGVKTATKERHSLKADLSTVNRFQGDNDPEILCKIMGNYSHTHQERWPVAFMWFFKK